MKKSYYLLLFVFFPKFIFSQIVISEVNFDTPYLENIYHYSNYNLPNPNPFLHHLGEFIELYNFSNEDISLAKWSLTDRVSKYNFPADAVITSGGFVLVAYRQNSNDNYFTNFFPTTVGKETQIYYQDKILLRNEKEKLRLFVGMLRGVDYSSKNIIASSAQWSLLDFGHIYTDSNLIDESTSASPNYYTESMQLIGDNSYGSLIATPLTSNYLPTIQNFEDIESVQEAILSFLSFYTWAINVDQIVNKSCPVNINIIEQTPTDTYHSSGKCFTYDDSGNIITSINCNPVPINNPVSTNYNSDEINEFSKNIILSPNPTYDYCNVNWSGNILGKITQIQVTSINATSITTNNITPTQNTAQINLSNQASGFYLFTFILNTGQPINKYVMKI